MRLGIMVNTQKEVMPSLVKDFLRVLIDSQCEFLVNEDTAAIVDDGTLRERVEFVRPVELVAASDLIVSFGGDGTLLSVSRLVGPSEKPILGVNIGKLGFLTEVELTELESAIRRLRLGQYEVEERMVLEARCGGGPPTYALNDFVVIKREVGRVLRVTATVDNYFLNTYTSDGLIVATPTGSTAYALSSNGPILTPTLEAIIINPICPHTLMVRPLVVNSESEIQLRVEKGYDAVLTADGREEGRLTHDTEVLIRRAGYKVRLVRLGERTYFDVLRTKLRWGEDVRNKGY